MKTKHIIQICILVVVTMLFVVPSDAGLTDGLVGYWKFDETSGDTASDSSLQGNTGTLVNMENEDWVTGQVGGALEFDGFNEYVEIQSAASLNPSDEVTVSIWAYIDPLAAGNDGKVLHLVSRVENINVDGGYVLFWDDRGGAATTNGIKFGVVEGGGSWGRATKDNAISSAGWYHLAGTYDKNAASNQIKLYINKNDVSTASYTSAMAAYNNDLFIGREPDAPISGYFDGTMDEVAIWNRALEESEIEQLYNTGLTGNPIPEPISCVGFVLGIVGLAVRRFTA